MRLIDLRQFYAAAGFRIDGNATPDQSIPCQAGGRIVAATGRCLAWVGPSGAMADRLGGLAFARIIQVGRHGVVILFPSYRFPDVAAVVKPKKTGDAQRRTSR